MDAEAPLLPSAGASESPSYGTLVVEHNKTLGDDNDAHLEDGELYQAASSGGGMTSPSASVASRQSRRAGRRAALRHAKRIYLSAFLSSWGERMWEFAATVFIVYMFPGTLFPPALFGFVESAATIFLGATMGGLIDKHNRLSVLRGAIVGQNLPVALACGVFYYDITQDVEKDEWKYGSFAFVLLAGGLAKLANVTLTVSLSRDWIVVLSDGSPELLTKLNSVLRRINLCCKVLAPLFVGLLSSFVSPHFAVLCVGGWNLISTLVEWNLIGWVYDKVPSLHCRKAAEIEDDIAENSKQHEPDAERPLSPSSKSTVDLRSSVGDESEEDGKTSLSCMDSWRRYFSHPVVLISVSYSFLYCTVLSFGSQFTAYLITQDLSDALVAGGRGVAALFGITSTFLYPTAVRKIGVVRTAFFGVWEELCALVVCVLAFFVTSSHWRPWMLMAGISLSRFGLWMMDMSESQIMQNRVAPREAGMIGGVESALVNTFTLLSFVLVMVFRDPDQFVYPAMISFGFVVGSALLATLYARKHPEDLTRISSDSDDDYS